MRLCNLIINEMTKNAEPVMVAGRKVVYISVYDLIFLFVLIPCN